MTLPDVRSEIIPLFLAEGLWSLFIKGTKERKRAKNYLDRMLFLKALRNSTTYQMEHWIRVCCLLSCSFSFVNDLTPHREYEFHKKKRTKKNILTKP